MGDLLTGHTIINVSNERANLLGKREVPHHAEVDLVRSLVGKVGLRDSQNGVLKEVMPYLALLDSGTTKNARVLLC